MQQTVYATGASSSWVRSVLQCVVLHDEEVDSRTGWNVEFLVLGVYNALRKRGPVSSPHFQLSKGQKNPFRCALAWNAEAVWIHGLHGVGQRRSLELLEGSSEQRYDGHGTI